MRVWANERSNANIEFFLNLGINGAGGRYGGYRIVGSVGLSGELNLLAWRLYVLGFYHDRGYCQESQCLVVPKLEKSEGKGAKAEIPSAKILRSMTKFHSWAKMP